MPEFEVRIFRTGEKRFQAIVIDARGEKVAPPKAAALAKKTRCGFLRAAPSHDATLGAARLNRDASRLREKPIFQLVFYAVDLDAAREDDLSLP